MIGDYNQLPYIDRLNLFQLRYIGQNLVTPISQELTRSYRCPQDVTYALNEVYDGIYTARTKTRSLRRSRLTGSLVPMDAPNALYLIQKGFGKGPNSRILIINESQGLTHESVVIIQTKSSKIALHDSVTHAVVAIIRHTADCTYYTDAEQDTIGRFIEGANKSLEDDVLDYNLKMAISHRDTEAITMLRQRNH